MYANPCGLGFWDFALLLHFLMLLDPFLHEAIKVGPTGSNQYCYWPVVETQVNVIYIREIPPRGGCPWITPAGLVR